MSGVKDPDVLVAIGESVLRTIVRKYPHLEMKNA